MTRPIIWATGTLVAIAAAASLAGDRIAALSSRPASAPVVAAAPVPAFPGDRLVTVEGDGRGHFTVRPRVDGRDVVMMVDTGASIVALRAEDAEAAGYRPLPRDFNRQIATANGTVMAAAVTLREVRIGDITVRDVEAVILPPGRLGTSLLGMSFLRRLSGFDIAKGRLTLRG